MLYVAAYDVSDDARRTRVARLLEDSGQRVQYSVFELDLNPNEVQVLINRLTPMLDSNRDSLLFYRLCASCSPQVRRMGQVRALTTPDGWFL